MSRWYTLIGAHKDIQPPLAVSCCFFNVVFSVGEVGFLTDQVQALYGLLYVANSHTHTHTLLFIAGANI